MPDVTGRRCNECSLCCRLLEVDDDQLDKPGGVWCPHARPGKGCAIYSHRPRPCRVWSCQWLVDDSLGDMWYPLRAGIVVDFTYRGDRRILRFIVDPQCPDRWREEPYRSAIRRAVATGMRSDPKFLTVISVGGLWLDPADGKPLAR